MNLQLEPRFRDDSPSEFRNAKKHTDKQNARIEHDKALNRVVIGFMKDDTELFKQFSDNQAFKRWLADTFFGLTCGCTDSPRATPW